MPNRDLKVTLVGDDKTSGAFKSASSNADGFGSKISSVGKGMALAFGGAVLGGVVGLGAALVQGGRDAASYQKITDQVAQTIKSTGGAAGVTASGLKDYAGQIESLSGVDEELVLQGQNVLLTFTNIRNEAGKGNDIFNQTSMAASNMAATMGTDLVSANTLVGKALNDPIKGLTALQRVGVSFTAQQKEQIDAMVKSGDTMGAQKVILAELNKEFGGAAKAAGQGLTGSIARAKDAFQDMFRGIATALLPKLADLAEFFTNTLMPGIKGLYDLVIGGDFTGALRDAFGWEEDSGPVTFLLGIRDAVISVINGIRTFVSAFQSGSDQAGGAISKVQGVVQQVAAFLGGAFQTIKAIFMDAVQIIQAVWSNFGANIVAFITSTLHNVMQVLQGAFTFIKGILDVFIGLFTGDWHRVWEGIKGIVTGAWAVITGLIQQALNLISLILSAAWKAISALASSAWNGLTSVVASAWHGIVNAVSTGVSNAVSWVASLPGRFLSALGNLGSLLVDAGRNLLEGLWNGIKGAGSWLLGKIGSFFGSLLPGWVRDMLGIHSPSTVFAEMGRYLMQGMAVGIDDESGSAVSAAQRAAAAISGAMSPRAAIPGMGALSLGAAPVGTKMLGGSPGPGPSAGGAVVHIENYNEAQQPPHEVAQELAFLARTR